MEYSYRQLPEIWHTLKAKRESYLKALAEYQQELRKSKKIKREWLEYIRQAMNAPLGICKNYSLDIIENYGERKTSSNVDSELSLRFRYDLKDTYVIVTLSLPPYDNEIFEGYYVMIEAKNSKQSIVNQAMATKLHTILKEFPDTPSHDGYIARFMTYDYLPFMNAILTVINHIEDVAGNDSPINHVVLPLQQPQKPSRTIVQTTIRSQSPSTGKIKRAPRTGLCVYRKDGSFIQGVSAADTMAKAIIEAGSERVMRLNIMLDGYNIITRREYPGNGSYHWLGNGYYVNTHVGNEGKKRYLEKISQYCALGWRIVIVK